MQTFVTQFATWSGWRWRDGKWNRICTGTGQADCWFKLAHLQAKTPGLALMVVPGFQAPFTPRKPVLTRYRANGAILEGTGSN
jgi:hypothetical protein